MQGKSVNEILQKKKKKEKERMKRKEKEKKEKDANLLAFFRYIAVL